MTYLPTLAAAAVLAAGIALASPANAQIRVENVRVQLPNGQYLTLSDSPERRWYTDERVAVYHRYVYEPTRRVYVIQDNRPDYVVVNHHRHGPRHCPPGHARKGWC